MSHPLDNPAWHALRMGNKALANGTDYAAYFAPAVSPFAAVPEPTPTNLTLLYQTIPFDAPIAIISSQKLSIDSGWTVLQRMDGLQMVYTKPVEPAPDPVSITPLTDQHIPQMLALTKLTSPGPFAERTIDFGHYEGIFDGNELIAMAGQRLHPAGFAEISAVCTHPNYTGKGHARQLIVSHITRIQAGGETPFLHVRADNVRAISVYEAMGFDTRTDVYFYFLRK